MVLPPEGLHALKQVAKEVGVDLRGAYLNLDGGLDSRANRMCIFHVGMIPNITEHPRNRKRAPSADAHASSTKPSMCCGYVSSIPVRGKARASGCYSDLHASSSDLWDDVDGKYPDQSAGILRCLKRATSYISSYEY